MKRLILALTLAASSAFAAPSLEEVATSPETFAVCKTIDVATTAYLLGHGFTEANPIVAWSLRIGGYTPLILVSAGIYWLMKNHHTTPAENAGINVITCVVAAHNLLLIS